MKKQTEKTTKKKAEKLLDAMFPTPKKFNKPKTFKAKDTLGKLLQKVSNRGTVRLTIRACGKGFQLVGYFGVIPEKFDLRGDCPVLLAKEALKIQKRGFI